MTTLFKNQPATTRPALMSLTADLVALCHRNVSTPDRDPAVIRFTDADFARAADALLTQLGGAPIWVFAYGSLLWKPASDNAERRRAIAPGWHRSFCLEMRSWRGSPEQPGLMMALRRGGACEGIAQRPLGSDRHKLLVRLLQREIGGPVGYAAVRLIDLQTKDGPVRALCFYVDPPEVAEAAELPPNRVAAILARACGHAGSGAEYLFKTVAALQAVDIHDPYLWQLQGLVADEIKNLQLRKLG